MRPGPLYVSFLSLAYYSMHLSSELTPMCGVGMEFRFFKGYVLLIF